MILVVRMKDPRELPEPVRDPVRLERARRPPHDLRVLHEPLDDRDLLALAERREVDLTEGRDPDPLLGGLLVDGRDARVRVLDVVDGILRRLARGHRQVELQGAVVSPREEGEARGVAADLLEQLLHQHELAATLGHAHGLAVTLEGHELNDQHLERVGRVPERLHRRLHARHIAVVVGPEQIDHAVGGAELHVVVVRDVHREIRHLAVRAAQHAILVVAHLLTERGRPEPERAFVLVRELARSKLLQNLLGQVEVTHIALLRRPHVELDPVVTQDAPLLLEDPQHGVSSEVFEPLPLAAAHEQRLRRLPLRHARAALLGEILAREVHQILARIAVVGQTRRLTQLLQDARLERARQGLELGARVVDVELGGDLRALRAQQARERVADRGRARADDHERAGRVRGDELEPDAAAALALAAAVGVARREDLAERPRTPRGRQEHVQEAGPGDLEPLDLEERRKVLHDQLGDLPRRPPRRAREGQRHVGGVVAVLRLARDLPQARLGLGQAGARQRRSHPFGQSLRDRHSPVSGASRRQKMPRCPAAFDVIIPTPSAGRRGKSRPASRNRDLGRVAAAAVTPRVSRGATPRRRAPPSSPRRRGRRPWWPGRSPRRREAARRRAGRRRASRA